tara:strand:+ start:19899 stop:20165 length:267 start_codon:yes stop_codon:yes gene_type:complete
VKLKNSILAIIIFISSCGNQLIKQSPDRRKSDRFYRLHDQKKGIIYNQKCKNIKKKKRECWTIEHDLLNDWDFFKGEFILIPQKYVFP